MLCQLGLQLEYEKEPASYRRKRYPGQKEALLKDIPHEKKLCTLAEEDRFCQTCGSPLVLVEEEFVRMEIELIPARIRVIDYYRETFECRECRKNWLFLEAPREQKPAQVSIHWSKRQKPMA